MADLLVIVVFTEIDDLTATTTIVVVGSAVRATEVVVGRMLLLICVETTIVEVEGIGEGMRVVEGAAGVVEGAVDVVEVVETKMRAGADEEGATEVEAIEIEVVVGVTEVVTGAGTAPSPSKVTELSGAQPEITVTGD